MNEKPKILVVDDEEAVRTFVKTAFVQQDYEVITASSGEDALTLLAGDDDFEVMLLDIRMPGLDGFEVLEMVRSNPRTEQIKVIILTAVDQVQEKVRAFSAGAVDYIVKPFETGELIARVGTHVKLRQAESQGAATLEALRASEARYRELVQNANSIIFRMDTQGRVTFFNEFAQSFFGYTEDEILGQSIVGTIVPERDMAGRDLAAMIQDIGRHPERYASNENENMRRNGERVWVAWTNKAVRDQDGRIVEVLCIGNDITERVRAGEALQESEERFRKISASAQDAIVIIDNEGNISFWNEAAEKIFGYSSQEVLGKNLHALLVPQRYHEAHRKAFAKFKTTGQGAAVGQTLELAAVRKDGTEFPVELSLSAVKLGGEWHAIGMMRDISERKQAEEWLRQERNKAQRYLDIAGVMLVALNEKGEITLINRKGCQILGYSEEELVGRNWFDICLPAQVREEVSGIFQQLMAGEVEPVEYYENPVLTRGGEERIIAWHNALLTDEAGDIIGTLSSGEDITERVQAQEAMAESLSLLQATLESTTDGILVVNNAGRMVAFNRKFVEMWHIPDSIVETRDDDQALASVLDRLVDPDGFLSRVRELYSQPDVESFDVLELKDGRLFERYSQPQWIGGQSVGRVWSFRDVTERVQAAEALRVSEERFALAVQGSNDGIWDWGIQNNSLYWSPRLKELLGYTDDELEIDFDTFDSLLHPDDREHTATAIEAHLKDGGLYDVEQRLRAKSGEYRWVRARGQAVWDEAGNPIRMVGSTTDITERKRAEEEIKRLKEFNEGIVQNMTEGIVVQDAGGYLTFVNPAAGLLLGYAPEELLGQHWTVIVPPDQQPIVRAADERRTRGEADRYELELLRKDGGRLSVLVSGNPRFEAGDFAGALAVFTDITQRVQMEEELHRAKEAAEAASRAKSEFLANMSHEIRTPMNGIIGMTELALGTDLTPEQREYLTAVQTSADALLGLLNDILDLSKIEASRLELEEVDFDLRGVIEKVADIMAQRASDKGLELMLHLHPEVPTGVCGDPLRLRQVLVNLTGNAIKFTEQGEVVVEVKRLREMGDEMELLCSVSDTGIGIPADKRDLIFDSFSQADSSTTRQYGGSGLGLTISRQLVEMMGGRIWVESEVGRGSTFYFTVVLQRKPDWVEAAPLSAVSLQDRRVLVVDDNATNRHILRETTRSFGCRPEEARDGIEGLKKLKRAAAESDPFELVLLDVQMPGMDGLDTLAAIRETPELKSLTAIMLTSVDGLGSVAHRRDLGWSAYLTKPVKQSQLLDAIMETVGKAVIEKGQARPWPEERSLPDEPPVSLRILLAEDNEINRRLATAVLERAGHQVVSAENGQVALHLLEQDSFDLIFMDVQMPEMDGLEATAAIRADTRRAHLPIIAMTAHAMKGDRERFLAAGMDDYVSKPIRADEVMAAIERRKKTK